MPSTRILSIETSGRSGSLALLEAADNGLKLVGLARLAGPERATAQTLVPTLKDLLAEACWQAASIGLVAVGVGPGSFTGLRIGVTTAKTFAYAIGAEVVGVNTLDVLAAQASAEQAPLWAILDAQRQELFAAKFKVIGCERPELAVNTRILSIDEWIAKLAPEDWVTGPPLKRLISRLPAGNTPVAEEYWQPSADALGRVGWAKFQDGYQGDVWKLVPKYYRLSAAEEKAAATDAAKQKGQGG